jgi:hypothetical protein
MLPSAGAGILTYKHFLRIISNSGRGLRHTGHLFCGSSQRGLDARSLEVLLKGREERVGGVPGRDTLGSHSRRGRESWRSGSRIAERVIGVQGGTEVESQSRAGFGVC